MTKLTDMTGVNGGGWVRRRRLVQLFVQWCSCETRRAIKCFFNWIKPERIFVGVQVLSRNRPPGSGRASLGLHKAGLSTYLFCANVSHSSWTGLKLQSQSFTAPTMSARHVAWRSVPSRSSVLSSAPPAKCYSQMASLSTAKRDRTPNARLRKPASTVSPSQNPSNAAFSFESLGANRTIKVIIIGCLTVVGTIESLFWAKVLWAKISPSSVEKGDPEGT